MDTLQEIASTSFQAPLDIALRVAGAHACSTCELSCLACADACVAEADIKGLRLCIRLNLDCADVCAATAKLLARTAHLDADILRSQLEACLASCELCARECEQHGEHHTHCQLCALACRDCLGVCHELIENLPRVA